MTVPDQTPPAIPASGPVVFRAPASGWSRQAYLEAVQAFVRARGHAPRTITMHPDTFAASMRQTALRGAERAADALADAARWGEEAAEWVADQLVEPAFDRIERGLSIATSREHDRNTIVME
jgi:hypothetical protein